MARGAPAIVRWPDPEQQCRTGVRAIARKTQRADEAREHRRIDRLHDVVVEAYALRAQPILLLAVPGNRHDHRSPVLG
jgi:hypothetical protein